VSAAGDPTARGSDHEEGAGRGDAQASRPRDAPDSADTAYILALAALPGMGPATLRELVAGRSARSCWEELCSGQLELPTSVRRRRGSAARRLVSSWRAAAEASHPERALARFHDLGIGVHVRGAASYPRVLEHDPRPPEICFTVGPALDEVGAAGAARVAVVGTRSCTHYGEEVAAELGSALAASGVIVVSGLAAGIDAAAHEGALVHADVAPPLAIVGCGVDVVYPAGNRRLRDRIAAAGIVMSEALPGAPPERWRFPARNRLIAACADVLVVVEAHCTGGAMHTVEAAIARGIAVAAVPGSVRSAASRGTNALIAEGAAVARDVDDVLALVALRHAARPAREPGGVAARRVGVGPTRSQRLAHAPAGGVSSPGVGARGGPDARVLDVLRAGTATLEAVIRGTGLGIGEASLALDRLAAGGLVRGESGAYVAADSTRRGATVSGGEGSARHEPDG